MLRYYEYICKENYGFWITGYREEASIRINLIMKHETFSKYIIKFVRSDFNRPEKPCLHVPDKYLKYLGRMKKFFNKKR